MARRVCLAAEGVAAAIVAAAAYLQRCMTLKAALSLRSLRRSSASMTRRGRGDSAGEPNASTVTVTAFLHHVFGWSSKVHCLEPCQRGTTLG